MELYISADYGNTWYFVKDVDWGSMEDLPYKKAGYSVCILSILDRDYWKFRSEAIFTSFAPPKSCNCH